MHTEILSEEQKNLLPLIKLFSKDYYLVGGTAIALQIGHRRSIDFDLFTGKRIQRTDIKKRISEESSPSFVSMYESSDQLHLKIKEVKVTFFQFPFSVPATIDFNDIIQMPSLLDLAAMKAFAFAERAKWKDYVDMYFILKYHHSLVEICKKTEHLFNTEQTVVFTKKLFRQQLCFFNDLDYSEQVEFVTTPVSDEEIKNFLTDAATQPF
ncbi:MAG: nucleotidyl transferase AbiEii/AbiGii toxin family protein [Bacteroidetes bacterium]|nr:nucleotidyl transferase AbiEii/AbiGii toxin family protein [Bacteroidota bacterium]